MERDGYLLFVFTRRTSWVFIVVHDATTPRWSLSSFESGWESMTFTLANVEVCWWLESVRFKLRLVESFNKTFEDY